jgi:hypothetical protein
MQKIVTESIQFAPQVSLSFSLNINAQIQEVNASFTNNQITVNLPQDIAQQWINTSQVGIEVQQNVENTEDGLHVLIEKDFPCNDREDEDKADTFWELAKDNENPSIC